MRMLCHHASHAELEVARQKGCGRSIFRNRVRFQKAIARRLSAAIGSGVTIGFVPTPIATIFYDSETGYFGYRYAFPGRPSHRTFATCPTLKDALDACDPQHEHDWVEPSDADERALLASRSYREGSVLWRMANFTVAELAKMRQANDTRPAPTARES